MSITDGPGEGTWSVFAQKIVEQRDAAREENTNLRETIEGVSRSLAATVNGWAYEHEPVLGVSQALKLACDTIEDLRAGRYAPIAGRGVSRAQYDEALNAIMEGDKMLEAAIARAEKAEAREKAIGDELEKATGRIEGLVKENERFRHAAAETADLLMRGALEDDLSSAQQMVAELRATLTTGRDIVIETSTGSRHTKWVEQVYDTLEASAPIANRWCLASERDAAIKLAERSIAEVMADLEERGGVIEAMERALEGHVPFHEYASRRLTKACRRIAANEERLALTSEERDAAEQLVAEMQATFGRLLKDHHVGHGGFPRSQCGVCKPIDEALALSAPIAARDAVTDDIDKEKP